MDTQVAHDAVGDSTTESGDWRAQLPADFRERITDNILNNLKKHIPYSGDEGLQELKNIAVQYEEEIYTASTDQSDYLRKISLKISAIGTKREKDEDPMSDPMLSNSASSSVNSQIKE